MSDRTCGYAVVDADGVEEPCGRPATGHRWYQDCGHEDVLDVACDWHENEGGRRLAAAEARIEAVRAWAMANEIAEPPLDWQGLGAALAVSGQEDEHA